MKKNLQTNPNKYDNYKIEGALQLIEGEELVINHALGTNDYTCENT